MKILAIQFRYLGDAVLLTPALRAIKERFSNCSLHVLVAEEVVPLLQYLPWLDRVWSFPRKRGRANLPKAWPIIRAVRRERFDRSVDFVGSDRGALISLLCGARQRIAPLRPGGFLGRRFCYTRLVPAARPPHESQANFGVLSAWQIMAPALPMLEIRADPARASLATELLPGRPILCHLTTSQPKKEWPIGRWLDFYRLATAAGKQLVLCAGTGSREQAILEEFKSRAPGAITLPPLTDLATFLAVVNRAKCFVSGDTGPLHFAAGLGIPTLSLFGPSRPAQWAPLGPKHRALTGSACTCGGNIAVCSATEPCMAGISAEQVFKALQNVANA